MKWVCLLGFVACFGADEALKPWSVDYNISGGIAGSVEHLKVSSDGSVAAEGRREGHAEFAATPAEMSAITAAIRKLNLSPQHPPAVPAKSHPAPDYLYTSLNITYDANKYPADAAATGFAQVLAPILARGLKLAEENKWTEAGAFRLGKVWNVDEEVRDDHGMYHGENWRGVWTRRGETNTFDAVWRNSKTNEEVRDTVVFDAAERGRIELHRGSGAIRYSGGYTPTTLDKPSGYYSPGHGSYWRTVIHY